jgi:hypothetical protein
MDHQDSNIRITAAQQRSLEDAIYNLLMENPDMDMGDMGNCREASETLVNNWINQYK